jgi:hypothetical protein
LKSLLQMLLVTVRLPFAHPLRSSRWDKKLSRAAFSLKTPWTNTPVDHSEIQNSICQWNRTQSQYTIRNIDFATHRAQYKSQCKEGNRFKVPRELDTRGELVLEPCVMKYLRNELMLCKASASIRVLRRQAVSTIAFNSSQHTL